MRTTKKEFKNQIQEHIIKCLSTDQYTELHFQLNEVVEAFKNWYSPYEQKRFPNRQEAFQDWLMGLPSELSVEYTNYGISETLKSWFENCGETYKEQKDELKFYTYLIYREFQSLCKQNKITLF
jgi:hypothetical protein